MDLRRERALIEKHQAVYGRIQGTFVYWAQYDPTTSTADPLYGEDGGTTGASWLQTIAVPVLWIDNIEGAVDQDAFRRDKSDDVRLGVSAPQFRAAGISSLADDDAHDLDIFYWPVKQQWYRVDQWEVLGNYGGAEFVVIGITGVQTYPDEEWATQAFPPVGAPPVT